MSEFNDSETDLAALLAEAREQGRREGIEQAADYLVAQRWRYATNEFVSASQAIRAESYKVRDLALRTALAVAPEQTREGGRTYEQGWNDAIDVAIRMVECDWNPGSCPCVTCEGRRAQIADLRALAPTPPAPAETTAKKETP